MCPALSVVLASAGILAHRGVEHDRQVGHGAGQRSGDVLRGRQRDHPGTARQATRAAQADQVLVRRGDADRPAGVAAHPGRGEAGTDSGAGAAARPARHAQQVVRVAGLIGERRDGRDAGRQLVHRRLAEDDRAGVAQTLHLERVGHRLQRGQAERAARRGHADRVEVVLHQYRNPVQRPARAGRRALAVEGVGFIPRVRVEEHDRVQPGSCLVVGPDSRQVRLDQSSRGDLAGGLRRLELEDGLLEHLEQRPRGRGRRGWRLRPSLPGEQRHGESGQQGRHGQAAGETASDHGAYCSGGPGGRRRSRAIACADPFRLPIGPKT